MHPLDNLKRLLLRYLVIAGILTHVVVVVGVLWAMHHYQLTPRRLAGVAWQQVAQEVSALAGRLSPSASPAFADEQMHGRLRPTHPRILLPGLASWNGNGQPALFRKRAAAYAAAGIEAPPACADKSLLGSTACWLTTGDTAAGRRALEKLRAFRVQPPKVLGHYGNAWTLALAYDLLSLHPGLTADDRAAVEGTLIEVLARYLDLLDSDSPSLWHGRAVLAADAWLCAVVLDRSDARTRELVRRAQAHFLEELRALQLVEAWPEGYNYWIQSRAFWVVLAAAAWINGLEGAGQPAEVRGILERTGLWTVYATRPDDRVEGLGDEGSRVDLKDETRRVIDLIAALTGNRVLSTFSRYLQRLHGRSSYWRGYRWGFRLFNDPAVQPVPEIEPGRLEGLARVLPRAALFGRGAMNLAYIRSGWGPNDTFISFRAGATFTHHGHYDAGHFSLFKGAPLAVNSSSYGKYTQENRLDYSIRTVAKNSLLVLRPGERVHPNGFFDDNVAGGGQRVVIPTGSGIRSIEDWRRNLGAGMHYEGGALAGFDLVDGDYAYVAADLTGAYDNTRYDAGGSGGKVSRVRRELLYLFGEDRLLVHDDVTATDPAYTKKWLLHTVERPEAQGLEVLRGGAEDGILQGPHPEATVHNGRGWLHVRALYPRDAVLRLVGGPDYRFYVEADGDDSDLDGKNFSQGADLRPWFDIGDWRIEIQPGAPRKRDQFLVSLKPGLDGPPKDRVERLETESEASEALITDSSVVIFSRTARGEPLAFALPRAPRRVYVTGIPPGSEVTLQAASGTIRGKANGAGLFVHALAAAAAGRVTVEWR